MRPEFTLTRSIRPGASQQTQHVLPASKAAAITLVLSLVFVGTTQPINSIYERIVLPLESAGVTPAIAILSSPPQGEFVTSSSSVLDLIDRLHATITDEEWAQTPSDLSSTINQTVYGA